MRKLRKVKKDIWECEPQRMFRSSIWIVQSGLNLLHSPLIWNKGVLPSFNSLPSLPSNNNISPVGFGFLYSLHIIKNWGYIKKNQHFLLGNNNILAVRFWNIEMWTFCGRLVAAMQQWINRSMCIKIFYRTNVKFAKFS